MLDPWAPPSHESLRASEARTRAILDSALDCIVMIDAAGAIIEFNPSAERTFGYTRAEVLGRELAEVIVPPAMREAHRRGLAHYLATGEGPALNTRLELTALRANGDEFPVELTITPVSLPGGPVFAGYLRDITERLRAEGELRERETQARQLAEEQAGLRRVATAVAREPAPEAIMGLGAREAAALLGVEAGMVVRFDAARATPLGWWGADQPRMDVTFPLDGSGALASVYRTGHPARIESYDGLDDAVARMVHAHSYRSSVAAPVQVAGRLWGAVLASSTRQDPIRSGAEDRLGQFAELIGTAIVNADSRAQLATLAATDSLTGLANHRAFHERLQAEVTRARRYGRELSVVVLDLDHFKSVNDSHGHQVGDEVLAEVGRRLGSLGRAGELVARIGGEEFAWLLPEVDGMGAFVAAERARGVISSRPFGPAGTLTLSAGVCELSLASGADDLLQYADGALYWAKVHGRDVTYRYSPEVIEVLSAEERARQLERTQTLGALRALARAVDAKDPSTQSHSERVASLAAELAVARGWDPEEVAMLRDAALVHDVGKIGVPDAILLKPGKLTAEEYEEIKRHARRGAEIVADVLSDPQVAWIRHHHERWGGGGYPDGISGEAIPEGGRLLALADAWDVMVSTRLYKAPRSPEDALAECIRESGGQFCPTSVAALETVWREGLPAGSGDPHDGGDAAPRTAPGARREGSPAEI